MDVDAIAATLPHRYPFLLVDRVLTLEPGVRITALKNVTINEPFFRGHFPGAPVMPGVLILEAMAQAGAILAYRSEPRRTPGEPVYFLGVDKARFRKAVRPGDQVRLELTVRRHRGLIWHFAARAMVDGTLVAEADLLASFTTPAPSEPGPTEDVLPGDAP